MSYAALKRRYDDLAVELTGEGVDRETIVAVTARRTMDTVVAILAILEAGAAWLPLDPAHPADRLQYVLQDSGARLLVSDEPSRTPPGVKHVAWNKFAGRSPSRGRRRPDPLDLAYVIYTSGSTGRPKGVMVTNGGVANLAAAQAAIFGEGSDRRVFQFCSPSFDAYVADLVMALWPGGTLVLPADGEAPTGSALYAALAETRTTHVTIPPSVLAEAPAPPAEKILDVLICAGETLPASVVTRWSPIARRMYNNYGPTENTVWATAAQVHRGTGRPPIGKPVHGVVPHVLDSSWQPVSPGEVGELFLGGASLSRGYLGRSDLTAERYPPDHVSGTVGARLYRTGDLVRKLPSGDLDFVGRADDQVKLRGVRVELGEISESLTAHPDVRAAVVVPVGEDANARLVAYVVTDLTSDDLRIHLARRLPLYLIPAAFVVLDALPLNSSGKVDRSALPEADRRAMGLASSRTAPRTPVEAHLARLVSDLLGVTGAQVGMTDNLYALGGNSLLLSRLTAAVRSDLGLEIPSDALFQNPTIEGLAKAAGRGDLPVLYPPARAGRRDRVPLSFPQERVWFLDQLSPGNLAYNAQAKITLVGSLDPDALRDTLTEIVRRHEIFRTAFRSDDDSPYQEVGSPFVVDLPVESVDGVGERTAEEAILAEMRQPFDVARPPLVRWRLLRHGPREHTLVQVEHHMVHDGWSFAVLLDEITRIYPSLLSGRVGDLPEPAIQYSDFAVWQRDRLTREVLRRSVEHWSALLDGCPTTLDLPTDRPRPPVQSFRGAALRVTLPTDLTRALRSFARSNAVSLYTTMLAGFGVLVGEHAGVDDLLIGSAMADRRFVELDRMIGMVVNTVVLRMDLTGRPDFREVLRRTGRMVSEAQAWQDVPIDLLVDAVAPVRDPSRNPLVQTMFSFHDSGVPDVDFGGLTGEVVELHNGSAKVDLGVVVVPRAEQRIGRTHRSEDDGITLIWEYATDLFDASTMRTMVDRYQTVLAQLVADTGTPVTDLVVGSHRHSTSGTPRSTDGQDGGARTEHRTPAARLLPSAHGTTDRNLVPPATATEKVVASVWSEVLAVPDVGVLDNFFDLGGRSLLIHQVRSRIARLLGAELDIIDFFEHPTIRALARHIDGDSDDGVTTVPGDRRPGPSRLEQQRRRRSQAGSQ